VLGGNSISSRGIVRFGDYELDHDAGELRREGAKVRLQEQPFQILHILLEQPGKVVPREELRKRIWPSDTFVDFDHGINNAIKRLREALGDTAETPLYIETLPRRGYRFKANVDGAPGSLRASAQLDSVAVLPFETANSDPDTDYLAVGIPGSVIHGLSQVPNLRVVSWRSAASEEGSLRDPLGIGRRLGVRAVLTGRIWQRANKLRLHVDLLDTTNGGEIWGDQYDSDLTELFSVQDSISREVSRKLRLKMTGETESRLVKRYTENVEAYQLYVKARRWCERRSAEGFRRAVEYLNQAIQIDPNYALAHAQLADCISVPCQYGSVDPNKAYPKARSSALRALEIDPDLSEGHEVLATVLTGYDWNWKAAEKEYKRAIELNPNCTAAHYHYSYLLAESGRSDEAIHEATEALSHDPMSPLLNAGLAFVFLLTRRYDRCIHQALTAIEVDPSMILGYFSLGNAYEQKGQHAAAIEAYEKGIVLGGPVAFYRAFTGHVYGKSGEDLKARDILQELKELSKTTYVPQWYSAIIYDGLGERDLAIEALEGAWQSRETMLVFLKVCPQFDHIRDDPRFQEIERRVGLRARC
jgi:TolB-like protein/Tfp pilus assembly protein PilF